MRLLLLWCAKDCRIVEYKILNKFGKKTLPVLDLFLIFGLGCYKRVPLKKRCVYYPDKIVVIPLLFIIQTIVQLWFNSFSLYAISFFIHKLLFSYFQPCTHECCEVATGKKCCPTVSTVGNCTLVIKDGVSLGLASKQIISRQ